MTAQKAKDTESFFREIQLRGMIAKQSPFYWIRYKIYRIKEYLYYYLT
jgi:hypothetical protein